MRFLVALLVFVLVSACLIAGIWLLIEPQYQARAVVRVRQSAPPFVSEADENGTASSLSSFVEAQASQMRSPTLLERVLERIHARDLTLSAQETKSPWMRFIHKLWGEKPPTDLDRLQAGLSVETRPDSQIVSVSFTYPDPANARFIADAVVTEYRTLAAMRQDEEQMRTREMLERQRVRLEAEVARVAEVCAELQGPAGMADPQELLSLKATRLEETQAHLDDLQRHRALLQWQISQVSAAGDSNDYAVADAQLQDQPRYHEDAEWRQRDIAVRTIRYNNAARQLEPNTPESVRARLDLEFAEELLQLRQTQLDEQWRDQVARRTADAAAKRVALKDELAQVEQEVALSGQQMQEQRARLGKLLTLAGRVETQHSVLTGKQALLGQIRMRLDRANMGRAAGPAIEVVSLANLSAEPYNDRRLVLTGGALLLGLLAAAVTRLFLRRAKDPEIQ